MNYISTETDKFIEKIKEQLPDELKDTYFTVFIDEGKLDYVVWSQEARVRDNCYLPREEKLTAQKVLDKIYGVVYNIGNHEIDCVHSDTQMKPPESCSFRGVSLRACRYYFFLPNHLVMGYQPHYPRQKARDRLCISQFPPPP